MLHTQHTIAIINELESDDISMSPTSTCWNSQRSSVSSINEHLVKTPPIDMMKSINDFLIECSASTLSEQEIAQLLKLIKNCICTTHENVLTRQNERLIESLELLGKKHSERKKAAVNQEREAVKRREHIERENKSIKQKLENALEDKMEAEKLLEEMRKEMEKVMDELESVKQESELQRDKANRLQHDLSHDNDKENILLREANIHISSLEKQLEDKKIKARESQKMMEKIKFQLIEAHQLQVAAVNSEKEELRKRLIKAENERKNSFEREREQNESELKLQDALKRLENTRKELDEVRGEFKKSKHQLDRLKHAHDQQLQIHRQDIQQSYNRQYIQQSDVLQVSITRELRAMACQIAELQVELENTTQQNATNLAMMEKMRQSNFKFDNLEQKKIEKWKSDENTLQLKIVALEGRVITLEKEALVLYSKNIEMARQLGELEP